jgi:hypothetical protein
MAGTPKQLEAVAKMQLARKKKAAAKKAKKDGTL